MNDDEDDAFFDRSLFDADFCGDNDDDEAFLRQYVVFGFLWFSLGSRGIHCAVGGGWGVFF